MVKETKPESQEIPESREAQPDKEPLTPEGQNYVGRRMNIPDHGDKPKTPKETDVDKYLENLQKQREKEDEETDREVAEAVKPIKDREDEREHQEMRDILDEKQDGEMPDTDESDVSSPTASNASDLTDPGKKAMMGVSEYSGAAQNEIARINDLDIDKRFEAVGKLKKENRKAWEELGNIGGINGKGVTAPNGEILIPFKDAKSDESE